MTKNRNKNSSSERSAASIPEDASKKSAKSSTSNGVSGPAPQGPRSGSCIGLILSTVFYLALIGAAGFAAFYLQQVVEEFKETSAKHEASARQSAELSSKMEIVVQQVESLRSVVDGLESSLGITRVELEGAVTRMKRGEVETRRVEEALQKLQNNLLKDLSDGITEVKEARERDFSSLEKTVEERLAEVSLSIKASVAEFTEAQGLAQNQLADLKARLGDMEDPALIKQELSVIVATLADIKTASDASDAATDSLRQQIGAVREELQTRNAEVGSLSQEIESVKSVAQEHVGSLKVSLTEAEAEVKALKDKSEILEGSVEQLVETVRNVEKEASAAAGQVKKTSEDLEVQVKAAEQSRESLLASVADISTKMESLLSKYDSHESTLSAQGQALEKVKSSLEEEKKSLQSSLESVQSNMAALSGKQNDQDSQDSNLGKQVSNLEKRIVTLEDGSKVKPEQLKSLTSMVAGLEAKAAKLEGHDQAIAALQKSLKSTTETLAGLSKSQGKKGK